MHHKRQMKRATRVGAQTARVPQIMRRLLPLLPVLPLLIFPGTMAVPAVLASSQVHPVHPVHISIFGEPDVLDKNCISVMPGEPIVLRWKVSDVAGRNTTIRLFHEGKDWLPLITLADESGRKVRVTNRSFVPAPMINNSYHGGRVASGSYQSGYLVLRPELLENTRPGNYTLNISVHLPYGYVAYGGRRTKPLPAVEQKVSLPVRIVPFSAEKMNTLAESLTEALLNRDYREYDGTRVTPITALFALPEARAEKFWRRAALAPAPPVGSAMEDLLDQLALLRTRTGADILADMWRAAIRTSAKEDWRGFSVLWLYRMYRISDPALRKHIERLFVQIDPKMKSPFQWEKERALDVDM